MADKLKIILKRLFTKVALQNGAIEFIIYLNVYIGERYIVIRFL